MSSVRVLIQSWLYNINWFYLWPCTDILSVAWMYSQQNLNQSETVAFNSETYAAIHLFNLRLLHGFRTDCRDSVSERTFWLKETRCVATFHCESYIQQVLARPCKPLPEVLRRQYISHTLTSLGTIFFSDLNDVSSEDSGYYNRKFFLLKIDVGLVEFFSFTIIRTFYVTRKIMRTDIQRTIQSKNSFKWQV